jgi:hypothetical protein
MKIHRCFFAAILVCGLASMAKGEDFKFQVLDPGYGNPIDGSFTLTFEPCAPGVYGGDGCFFGYNNTDETFTSLHVVFPDSGSIVGQTVTCDVGGLFPEATCTNPSPGDDDFTLDFYGGSGIGSGVPFLLLESGAGPDDFPSGQAYFGVAPEPGSIWMLSSKRRRSGHNPLF